MNEVKRLHYLQKIVEGQMTAVQVAGLLRLSLRQVRRLVAGIGSKVWRVSSMAIEAGLRAIRSSMLH